MPAFIKTDTDERLWQEAKEIVVEQTNKPMSKFTDRDWGLVTHIWKQKNGDKDMQHKANMVGLMGQVDKFVYGKMEALWKEFLSEFELSDDSDYKEDFEEIGINLSALLLDLASTQIED